MGDLTIWVYVVELVRKNAYKRLKVAGSIEAVSDDKHGIWKEAQKLVICYSMTECIGDNSVPGWETDSHYLVIRRYRASLGNGLLMSPMLCKASKREEKYENM